MDLCQAEGCTRTVSKPGHSLCLEHWKAERSGQIKRCGKCERWHAAGSPCRAAPTQSDSDDAPDEPGYLSSTKIGKHFGISSVKINLILAELGWIEKYVKGWSPTDRGNALGANVREMRNGTPYVVWPESILKNAALLDSVFEQSGGQRTRPAAKRSDENDDFRTKFPATFRTQDGHMVRSRAEVLIDN
jgi:hypothetical protein